MGPVLAEEQPPYPTRRRSLFSDMAQGQSHKSGFTFPPFYVETKLDKDQDMQMQRDFRIMYPQRHTRVRCHFENSGAPWFGQQGKGSVLKMHSSRKHMAFFTQIDPCRRRSLQITNGFCWGPPVRPPRMQSRNFLFQQVSKDDLYENQVETGESTPRRTCRKHNSVSTETMCFSSCCPTDKHLQIRYVLSGQAKGMAKARARTFCNRMTHGQNQHRTPTQPRTRICRCIRSRSTRCRPKSMSSRMQSDSYRQSQTYRTRRPHRSRRTSGTSRTRSVEPWTRRCKNRQACSCRAWNNSCEGPSRQDTTQSSLTPSVRSCQNQGMTWKMTEARTRTHAEPRLYGKDFLNNLNPGIQFLGGFSGLDLRHVRITVEQWRWGISVGSSIYFLAGQHDPPGETCFSLAGERHISNFALSTPKLHGQLGFLVHYIPSSEVHGTCTGLLLRAIYGAGPYHLRAGEKSLPSGSVTEFGGDENLCLRKECTFLFLSANYFYHSPHVFCNTFAIPKANRQPDRRKGRSFWSSEINVSFHLQYQNQHCQCPFVSQVRVFSQYHVSQFNKHGSDSGQTPQGQGMLFAHHFP